MEKMLAVSEFEENKEDMKHSFQFRQSCTACLSHVGA